MIWNGYDERAYVIQSHIRVIRLLNEEIKSIYKHNMPYNPNSSPFEKKEEPGDKNS